jgi:hypothetical protein
MSFIIFVSPITIGPAHTSVKRVFDLVMRFGTSHPQNALDLRQPLVPGRPASASPHDRDSVAARLPETNRLRFALHGGQRMALALDQWPDSGQSLDC